MNNNRCRAENKKEQGNRYPKGSDIHNTNKSIPVRYTKQNL